MSNLIVNAPSMLANGNSWTGNLGAFQNASAISVFSMKNPTTNVSINEGYITDQLVFYLNSNDNTGTDSKWIDKVHGLGFDLINFSPSYKCGWKKEGLLFDGLRTQVTIPQNLIGLDGKELTLEIVLNPMHTALGYEALFCLYGNTDSQSLRIYGFNQTQTGQANSFYYVSNSYQKQDGSFGSIGSQVYMKTEQQHHLVVAYHLDGSHDIYLNNVLLGHTQAPTGFKSWWNMSTLSSDLSKRQIGKGPALQNFEGYIKEVRLYNKALTSEEVKNNYNVIYNIGNTITPPMKAKANMVTPDIIVTPKISANVNAIISNISMSNPTVDIIDPYVIEELDRLDTEINNIENIALPQLTEDINAANNRLDNLINTLIPPRGNNYLVDLGKWGIREDGTDAAATRKGINDAMIWADNNNYTVVVLPKGEYLIDLTPLRIPDGVTLELDDEAFVKIQPNTVDSYTVFDMTNSRNIILRGGNIVGDKATHDPSHNLGNAITIKGAKHVIIDACNIYDFTGSGVNVGYIPKSTSNGYDGTETSQMVYIENCEIYNCKNAGVFVSGGFNVWINHNTFYQIGGGIGKAIYIDCNEASLNISRRNLSSINQVSPFIDINTNIFINGNQFRLNPSGDIYNKDGYFVFINYNDVQSENIEAVKLSGKRLMVSRNTFSKNCDVVLESALDGANYSDNLHWQSNIKINGPKKTFVSKCTINSGKIYGKMSDGYIGAPTVDTVSDTFTLNAHGLNNGDIIYFEKIGSLPGGIDGDKNYFIVNATNNTFKVSLTNGGAVVDITSTGNKFGISKYGTVGVNISDINLYKDITDTTSVALDIDTRGGSLRNIFITKYAIPFNITPDPNYYGKATSINGLTVNDYMYLNLPNAIFTNCSFNKGIGLKYAGDDFEINNITPQGRTEFNCCSFNYLGNIKVNVDKVKFISSIFKEANIVTSNTNSEILLLYSMFDSSSVSTNNSGTGSKAIIVNNTFKNCVLNKKVSDTDINNALI